MKFFIPLICLFFPLFLSCVFNADYPLDNSGPQCISHSEINRDLFFPDSVVCTLSVSDLNDKNLTLAVVPDSYSHISDSTPNIIPWPGNYLWLDEKYGAKRIVLTLNTCLLDLYKGNLVFLDPFGLYSSIPFKVHKEFYEPFNTGSSLDIYWKKNKEDDSCVQFDYNYTEPNLKFFFSDCGDSLPVSTGVAGRFSLSGDFHITIDFKLRDEMTDGFEISFYVSTSADTNKWIGEKAGIFISGTQGQIRLECKSINLQSYSSDVTLYSGELGISRNGSRVQYYYYDGNPQVTPISLVTHDFNFADSVYVHIRMSVENGLRKRHCLWNDFYVLKGKIAF